jgi:hypothetical protein
MPSEAVIRAFDGVRKFLALPPRYTEALIRAFDCVRRFFAMPPQHMLMRLQVELSPYFNRLPAGEFEVRLTEAKLLRLVQADSLESLHERVMAARMPWSTSALDEAALAKWAPAERSRVLEKARTVLDGRVRLLGSGPIGVLRADGGEIDWHVDPRSKLGWPFAYFHDLDPADLERASDVKLPWELSRLQWLIPVAQAWRLTGEERYSRYVGDVLEHWLTHNPYAWASTGRARWSGHARLHAVLVLHESRRCPFVAGPWSSFPPATRDLPTSAFRATPHRN